MIPLSPHRRSTPSSRAWLAVSLGSGRGEELRGRIARLQPWADAVELRLDLLPEPVPEDVLQDPPLPTVITYRPRREGGRYEGPEAQRLATLRSLAERFPITALDVEWDAVDNLGPVQVPRIVSRHYFDRFPRAVESAWEHLAHLGGEIVKLAATTHTLEETLRLCSLFLQADRPTILIAMGDTGLLSRLIAPFYPAAYLTYAAPTREQAVAPGQIAVQDMRNRYHVHRLHPGSDLIGYLALDAHRSPLIPHYNQKWAQSGEDRVLLPLAPTREDALDNVIARAWELGFQRLWVAPPLTTALGLGEEAVWLLPTGEPMPIWTWP